MICELLLASVILHEGRREHAYRDTKGIYTIGYGTNIDNWDIPERFMSTMAITQDCMECWTRMHLEDARASLARQYPWALYMAPARVDVLVEMLYNLGHSGLSKFPKMMHYLKNGMWHSAEYEALHGSTGGRSHWYIDVGQRAKRLAGQLRTGEYWNAEEECDDATD